MGYTKYKEKFLSLIFQKKQERKYMIKSVESLKRMEFLEALGIIIFGLLLAIFPNFWGQFISVLLGILIIAIGVGLSLNSWLEKNYRKFPLFKMICGIAMIAVGIFFIFNKAMPISIFGVIIGIIVLLYGTVRITNAINDKNLGKQWIWPFVESVINLLFGFFMIINPLTGVNIWIISIGLYLVYIGISFFILIKNSKFEVL